MDILRYTSAPEQILDDMDRHAKDIEETITLYNNNMYMIFRKFYSNDCPDCAGGRTLGGSHVERKRHSVFCDCKN